MQPEGNVVRWRTILTSVGVAAAAVAVCTGAVLLAPHHTNADQKIVVAATQNTGSNASNSIGQIPTVPEPHVTPPTDYVAVPVSSTSDSETPPRDPVLLNGMDAIKQAKFKVKVPYIPKGYKLDSIQLEKYSESDQRLTEKMTNSNGGEILISTVYIKSPTLFHVVNYHKTTFDGTTIQIIQWDSNGHAYCFIKDGLLYRIDSGIINGPNFLPKDDIVSWQVIDSLIKGTKTYN